MKASITMAAIPFLYMGSASLCIPVEISKRSLEVRSLARNMGSKNSTAISTRAGLDKFFWCL